MNYLIKLSFDGAAFHGWQRQNNADSVQARVEDALQKLFGVPIRVTGCSRTDAGVHANEFCANFVCEKQMPPNTVVSALNFYLPESVAVLDCSPAPDGFNARFSCVSKEYIYKIWNAPIRNPFTVNRALFYRLPLDEAFLDAQAKALIGTHDFSAFMAAGSSAKTTVRTILYAGAERAGDEIILRFEANGFLYNMVRIMSGTLLYIAQGKIEPDSIPEIIASRDRLLAGKTLPPEGLYLNRVTY